MTEDRMLEGRVAVVTGAARGLGAGIALALAEAGANVICCDVEDASEVAAEIEAVSGRTASATRLDVTDRGAVDDLLAEVDRDWAHLDIVVNNAGTAQPVVSLAETEDDVLEKVLATNVKGTFFVSRAAGRIMQDARHGAIINVASQVGKLAWPKFGVYSASKAAVIALTQALALELAPYRVTVNCVCPGTMDTEMTRGVFAGAAAERGIPLADMLAEKAASIPLGRLGTPADVGKMVAWLASDSASFTTGAAMNVTGGESVFF